MKQTTADMDEVLVVWTEDQTRQRPNLEQHPLFSSMKAERGEEAAEEELEVAS